MICALLFFGTTINYIDRQVIGILKPTLVQQFGWQDERIYAAIVFTFQLAYAIGLLLAGRVMDKLGTRRGFAIAVVIWSVAAIGHAVAERMRLAEAPDDQPRRQDRAVRRAPHRGRRRVRAHAVPARASARRATSPPPSRRWRSGSPRRSAPSPPASSTRARTSAPCVTPLVVPWITLHWGWQWAFVATGLTGFVWLAWWLAVYRPPEEHPAPEPGRAGLHPQRPGREDHAHPLGAPDPPSADLGLRPRQVHDRSHLVAVPLLDPRFPQPQLRPQPQRRSACPSSSST